MKKLRTCRFWLAQALLLVFLFQQSSCAYYQRYEMGKSRLPKIPLEGLHFYLIDSAHPLSKMWLISDYTFEAKSMQCRLSKVADVEAVEITKVRGRRDAKNSRNEVLMYAKPSFAAALTDSDSLTIDYAELEKIEVFELNHGKTMGMTLLGAAGTLMVISIIALLAKASCPFVYAENADASLFQGELYSGSIYPQLERHDWLPLPDLEPQGDEYRIRLANRAKEIQHTNLLELLAVDHRPGCAVLFDKNGRLQTLSHLQAPLQAQDWEGRELLAHIRNEDSLAWTGGLHNRRPDAQEGLILTFAKPAGARQAKLVIHAKNTFWVDYMYGLFLDEFGSYAPELRQRYLKKSAAEINEWTFDQQIPLRVAVEKEPGVWTHVDYFHLAGPMAFKKDVLVLDLSDLPGDQFRIRLGCGFQFWEIDYVGIDYTENEAVSLQSILPVSALSQHGTDMAAALSQDDAQYYSQPEIGDEALVIYPKPAQAAGTERSLLLHAKGHYEILRAPLEHTPNPLDLYRFSKENALPKYSRERWQEIMRPELLSQTPEQPN